MRGVCGLVLLLVVLGAAGSAAAQSCGAVGATGTVHWTPQWCDEFNGTAGTDIDSTKWSWDTGILNVNNELEYYCSPGSSTAPCDAGNSNAYLDGSGHLVIQAIRLNNSTTPYSGSWTSARPTTNGKMQFKYGRIESSLALPVGPGIWPAFWSLGANITGNQFGNTAVTWPGSGEMDFMENVPASAGLGPTKVVASLHGNGYSGGNSLHANYTFPNSDVTTFHTYGAIWSPFMVQFYVDDPGNVYQVRTEADAPGAWAFNHTFFWLYDLAIGGDFPGPPDNTTPSPAVMTVDYVRYATPDAIAAPNLAPSPASLTVKAGATSGNTSSVTLSGVSGTGRYYVNCTTNAPKASCSVAGSDPMNMHTVDLSSSGTGSVTVTFKSTANTNVASLEPRSRGWLAASLASGLGTMLGAVWLASGRRQLGRVAFVLAALCLLMFLAACGGGTSAVTLPPPVPNGTAPGNYTMTVSAYSVASDPDKAATVGSLTINVTVN